MPRKNRTLRRRSDSGLEALREEVKAGKPWTADRMWEYDTRLFELIHDTSFWSFLPDSFKGDDAARRAAWEALRDDILAGHIEHHPGTRPAAWWLYDAPEERNIRAVRPSREWVRRAEEEVGMGNLPSPGFVGEAEWQQLERLGELRDGELERMRRQLERDRPPLSIGEQYWQRKLEAVREVWQRENPGERLV